MATLEELRAQLDGIDNEIIELYKKRMDVCMEIGDIKISAGNKVFDKQREREKLAAVAAKVTEEFHKKGVHCTPFLKILDFDFQRLRHISSTFL